MSSSLSTLSASLLEMWSDILDMLDQLHTGSIEFTVLREQSAPLGLEINIRCLLAEQKDTSLTRIPEKDVEKGTKDGLIV
ncbi:hypothetical protein ES705_24076 [subsurface metagenome]